MQPLLSLLVGGNVSLRFAANSKNVYKVVGLIPWREHVVSNDAQTSVHVRANMLSWDSWIYSPASGNNELESKIFTRSFSADVSVSLSGYGEFLSSFLSYFLSGYWGLQKEQSHGLNMLFTRDHMLSIAVPGKTHVQHKWTSVTVIRNFCTRFLQKKLNEGFIWRKCLQVVNMLFYGIHVIFP